MREREAVRERERDKERVTERLNAINVKMALN